MKKSTRQLASLISVPIAVIVAWWLLAERDVSRRLQDLQSPTASDEASMTELQRDTRRIPGLLRARESCETETAAGERRPEYRDYEDYFNRLIKPSVNVLSKSTELEHRLAAAMLMWTHRPRTSLILLQEIAPHSRNNAFMTVQILSLCMRGSEYCGLSSSALESQAISADRSNAMMWLHVAGARLAREDDVGALAAIAQAAAASEYNEYYVDTVMMFDRALAASSNLTSMQRLGVSLSITLTVRGGDTRISSECVKRSEHHADWYGACLDLGARMERDGRTMLTKKVGIQLQTALYEQSGDTRAKGEVEKRGQELEHYFQDQVGVWSAVEAYKDEAALRDYLEVFAASNELSAVAFLSSEYRRRAESGRPDLEKRCEVD